MTVTVKNQLNLFTTYGISSIFTTLFKGDGHEEKEAQPHHSPPRSETEIIGSRAGRKLSGGNGFSPDAEEALAAMHTNI